MTYKKEKNLLASADEYNRYYGDFMGVDFSSDHTQVHERRFAYAVNMYKDYGSGQGQAIETIPGFRRIAEVKDKSKIYGIHRCEFLQNGERLKKTLVHAGKKLYEWVMPIKKNEDETEIELITEIEEAVFESMNERNSVSFIFNNRLYIIDGKNYLVYDGKAVKDVCDSAYVPTTYIGIIPGGENADAGKQFENRNMLSPYFKNTFVARADSTEYYLSENDFEEISEIKVYGVKWDKGFTVDRENGCITFDEISPGAPEENGYPEGYAGIEVTAKKTLFTPSGGDMADMIRRCTVAEIYDGRVFLSGNPEYPNYVFYCDRNTTGYADPSYFGLISYVQDGVGNAPVTGLMRVADTLMVLKSDTQQDGSVYFHTAQATGEDLVTKIYPSTQGLAGIGCLGACRSFLDDPIFISRLGVEAIGQLSVRYERAVEHRSSLIDAKLTGLELSKAQLEEWNGYLLLLIDGKIFMADSRQKYTNSIGVTEYEWYYLENIGVYEDDYECYRYAMNGNDDMEGKKVELDGKLYEFAEVTPDMDGVIANPVNEEGKNSDVVVYESDKIIENYNVKYIISGGKAYYCETTGERIGGVFHPACLVKNIDGNIYFGTDNGVICAFNFDKREENGEIASSRYHFDGHVINCGCATKMDCCGIPHLTKTTIKKSIVIKTRSMSRSAAKVKVRTNKKFYYQIARINSTVFSFDDIIFSDFSFATDDQSLFALREKEKKWVEKQYYIYSDEYCRPFSLYYIAFRYRIVGRYKGD